MADVSETRQKREEPSATSPLLANDVHKNLLDDPRANNESVEVKVYARRWLVLAVFCLNLFCAAATKVTYVPIAVKSQNHFGVSARKIDMLSQVGNISFLPGIFYGAFTLQRFGLAAAVFCATTGTAVANVLRFLGRDIFWMTMIAQSISALTIPFANCSVVVMSANWFPESQRTVATSVSTFIAIIGGAAVFAVTGNLVVSEPGDPEFDKQFELNLLIFMGMSCLTAVLTYAIFRSKPPTPPSISAAMSPGADEDLFDEDGNAKPSKGPVQLSRFGKDIGELVRNKNYLLLFVQFGFAAGAIAAYTQVINQIAAPVCMSRESSNWGIVLVVCGLTGAIVLGTIADRTKQHYRISMITAVLICVAMWALAVLFRVSGTTAGYQKTEIAMYFVNGILGGAGVSTLPIVLELVAETTYPIPEGTSVGILYGSSNIFITAIVYGALALPVNVPCRDNPVCCVNIENLPSTQLAHECIDFVDGYIAGSSTHHTLPPTPAWDDPSSNIMCPRTNFTQTQFLVPQRQNAMWFFAALVTVGVSLLPFFNGTMRRQEAIQKVKEARRRLQEESAQAESHHRQPHFQGSEHDL